MKILVNDCCILLSDIEVGHMKMVRQNMMKFIYHIASI
jgi:hypothetical protein